MLKLTEGEKHYLLEMRALSTNTEGHDVFVGLTSNESERYHFLSNPLKSLEHSEREEYLALHEKHELARLLLLDAENTMRVEQPSLH